MSDTHTPGSWKIDRRLTDNGAPIIVAYSPWLKRARLICKVLFDGGSEDPEVQANARVVAAAPDMLLILKETAEFWRERAAGAAWYSRILAAIDKAERG